MLPDDHDRKRGILSPPDREYLLTPEEYAEGKSRQSVLERKEAIKQRIRDSILDLALLFDHLPPDIHADVFGRAPRMGSGPLIPESFEEIEAAVPDAVAFLYSAASGPYGHPREEPIEEAILRVEEQGQHTVDVDVTIDRQQVNYLARKGAEKMDAGERVTNTEVRAMLKEGIVEPEAVAAHLRGEDTVSEE